MKGLCPCPCSWCNQIFNTGADILYNFLENVRTLGSIAHEYQGVPGRLTRCKHVCTLLSTWAHTESRHSGGVTSEWQRYVRDENFNFDGLRHYGQCKHDTCHNATLRQGLSFHNNLSDLHSRTCTQRLIENVEISSTFIFADIMSTTVTKLGTKVYFVDRPFGPYQFLRSSSKLTVIKAGKSAISNSNIGVFSGTIIATVMKLGTVVAFGKAFQGIPVKLTFMQGQRR